MQPLRAHYSKPLQMAYDTLYRGITQHMSTIMVPIPSLSAFHELWQDIILDNPLLFHVRESSATFQGATMLVTPTYLMGSMEYRRTLAKIQTIIDKVVRATAGLDDYHKVLYVHDYLYDLIDYQETDIYSHNIVGALIRGKAVCDGFATGAKAIFDAIGIPCAVVYGTANGGHGCQPHAWNKVQVNGTWCQLDITFDNRDGKEAQKNYSYFLASDRQLALSHHEDSLTNISCNSEDLYYFKVMGLSFKNPVLLKKHLASVMPTHPRTIALHLPYLVGKDLQTATDHVLYYLQEVVNTLPAFAMDMDISFQPEVAVCYIAFSYKKCK